MPNFIDAGIIEYINGFARHSIYFDALAHAFVNNYLFKSASLIALLYWAWFQPVHAAAPAAAEEGKRARILITLFAAVMAPTIARIIELVGPFRPRPMHEEQLNLTLPYFMRQDVNLDWSSFPSDTAALITPLALGLWLVSRRLGLLACAIVLLAMAARIYSGLHYPSDILGGALLGILCFKLLDWPAVKTRLTAPCLRLLAARPELFYAGFFLLTYQIANIFWESFTIVKHLFKLYG